MVVNFHQSADLISDSLRDQHEVWEVDWDSFSDSSDDIEVVSVQPTENNQRRSEAYFLSSDEILSSPEYIRELFSRIRPRYDGSSIGEPDPIGAYHCFGADCCEDAGLSGSIGDPDCHPPIPIRWNWSNS